MDPARSEEQMYSTMLLIREVKVEDSGEYVCSGSGDPASPAATATITLVVKSKLKQMHVLEPQLFFHQGLGKQ